MSEEKKGSDASGLLGGVLNIFGLKIDLGELLAAPENAQARLEELREKLEAAGGKGVLSAEEWRQAGATVSGHIRTRGLLGEHEFHIGTAGRPGSRVAARPAPPPQEVTEPPVDVFDEAEDITIIADVPGVGLEDLEVKVEDGVLVLSTTAIARRSYRKELRLDAEVEPGSLKTACNNGVLELRLRKRPAGPG